MLGRGALILDANQRLGAHGVRNEEAAVQRLAARQKLRRNASHRCRRISQLVLAAPTAELAIRRRLAGAGGPMQEEERPLMLNLQTQCCCSMMFNQQTNLLHLTSLLVDVQQTNVVIV